MNLSSSFILAQNGAAGNVKQAVAETAGIFTNLWSGITDSMGPQLGEFIPKLLGAIVILVVGYIIARIIRWIVTNIINLSLIHI